MMRFYDATLNAELIEFWRKYARPGRIGLIHIDFAPAKVFNWAERWATPTRTPSRWTHTFIFLHSEDGIPRFAESDARVPLPGFDYAKPDGPQINSIYKWSHHVIDEAAVVDPRLNRHQLQRVEARVTELVQAGLHYPRAALADTLMALVKGDLRYRGPLASDNTMHCSQLVQECLIAAGASPFPPQVQAKNVVPEHFAQLLPMVARWQSQVTNVPEDVKVEGLRRAYSVPRREAEQRRDRRGSSGDSSPQGTH